MAVSFPEPDRELPQSATRCPPVAVHPPALTKRLLDVAISLMLLVVVAPTIGLLALIIMIDSRGGPFFVQTRVGLGGREFRFVKLRTMVKGAEKRLGELTALNEAQPPLFKIKRDPRVTRVGGFLRRSSLDELPQLWNVLVGDMSLVGPRPPLPREVATYTTEQARRLSVTPGMTGLWQVSGRSDVDFEQAVALDLTYIDTWSLALDLSLLLKTLLVVVRPRGAY